MAGFYTARSGTIPPLPWTNFAPPLSLYGAVLGALFVGVAGEVALIWISPVYQSLTAFVAILVVLLVKPTGLFAGASGVRR